MLLDDLGANRSVAPVDVFTILSVITMNTLTSSRYLAGLMGLLRRQLLRVDDGHEDVELHADGLAADHDGALRVGVPAQGARRKLLRVGGELGPLITTVCGLACSRK